MCVCLSLFFDVFFFFLVLHFVILGCPGSSVLFHVLNCFDFDPLLVGGLEDLYAKLTSKSGEYLGLLDLLMLANKGGFQLSILSMEDSEEAEITDGKDILLRFVPREALDHAGLFSQEKLIQLLRQTLSSCEILPFFPSLSSVFAFGGQIADVS